MRRAGWVAGSWCNRHGTTWQRFGNPLKRLPRVDLHGCSFGVYLTTDWEKHAKDPHPLRRQGNGQRWVMRSRHRAESGCGCRAAEDGRLRVRRAVRCCGSGSGDRSVVRAYRRHGWDPDGIAGATAGRRRSGRHSADSHRGSPGSGGCAAGSGGCAAGSGGCAACSGGCAAGSGGCAACSGGCCCAARRSSATGRRSATARRSDHRHGRR